MKTDDCDRLCCCTSEEKKRRMWEGMNKRKTSDAMSAVFYLHTLIAYHWILALFFFFLLAITFLRKWQTRCIAIWLEYTKKPSNATRLGLRARQRIHSLGSLAFQKIARKDRLVNALQCLRWAVAFSFVNEMTLRTISDKLSVLKISQSGKQSNLGQQWCVAVAHKCRKLN